MRLGNTTKCVPKELAANMATGSQDGPSHTRLWLFPAACSPASFNLKGTLLLKGGSDC